MLVKWWNKKHPCNLVHLNKGWMMDSNCNNIAVFPVSHIGHSVTIRMPVSVWFQSVNQSFSKPVSIMCVCVCYLQVYSPSAEQGSPFTDLHGQPELFNFPGDTGQLVKLVRCPPVSPAWKNRLHAKVLWPTYTTTKSERNTKQPNKLVWAAKIHEQSKCLHSNITSELLEFLWCNLVKSSRTFPQCQVIKMEKQKNSSMLNLYKCKFA